jgi:pimeloyl-ACP methyl ester carboxylesterase
MEQILQLKTTDKHLIYSTITSPKQPLPTSKCVIFVHGFGGQQHEHQFFNAVPFFATRGYAVCRFNFYGIQKDARRLHESTLQHHVNDLNRVLTYCKDHYNHLYLVGHSFGAVVVLMAHMAHLRALVLWDPMGNPNGKGGIQNKREASTYNKYVDAYIPDYGPACLIHKDMYRDWVELPKPAELMRDVHVPVKIITASKSSYVKNGRAYHRYAHNPKAYVAIAGATHCFNEEGTEQELFEETYAWINTF